MIKSNLAVLMAKREINITELHKATGISRNTISAIYNNTAKGIQYDTLDKLCTFFNVDSNEILEYIFMNIYIGDKFINEYNQEYFHIQVSNQNKTFETTIRFNTVSQKDLYENISHTLNIWLNDDIAFEISEVPNNKYDDFMFTQIVDPIFQRLELAGKTIEVFIFRGISYTNPVFTFTYNFI